MNIRKDVECSSRTRANLFGELLRDKETNRDIIKVQVEARRTMKEKLMRDEMEALQCKVRFQ